MNKSELPFLRSSFIQRVFYLVLTSNNVFTHEIIVSIASLHCKICFQLLIMYLLIWTQRKKGAKPRTFGSYAKLNHWHFIIPKSEKYVKWYFYTRCSSTFFFDHQQNRRKTFYWTVGYEWGKRNIWTERSVLWQSGNFYQRQHQPFFSLIRGNIYFFSLDLQYNPFYANKAVQTNIKKFSKNFNIKTVKAN